MKRIVGDCQGLCEWTLKLFGWMVLLGVLLKPAGEDIEWASASGVALLAFVGFVGASMWKRGYDVVDWLNRIEELQLRGVSEKVVRVIIGVARYGERRKVLFETLVILVVMLVPTGLVAAAGFLWVLPIAGGIFVEVVAGAMKVCG